MLRASVFVFECFVFETTQQLLLDFDQFARRMRLLYIFRGENNEPHPYHVKSAWKPPIQRSVALESYLEEVESDLAEIEITKPKNNLPPAEREALRALKRDTDINLTKADKGTITVVMNTQDKIKEGQILLERTTLLPCVSRSEFLRSWLERRSTLALVIASTKTHPLIAKLTAAKQH